MTDYVKQFKADVGDTEELLSLTHEMVAFGFIKALEEAVEAGMPSCLADSIIDQASDITAIVLAEALIAQEDKQGSQETATQPEPVDQNL